MSIDAELREEFDSFERRETAVVRVLPYGLLAVSTIITLLQPLWGGRPMTLTQVGLTVVTAAWLVWPFVLRQGRSSSAVNGLYYGGFIVLAAALVLTAPWYAIFAFVGYVHAFLVLAGRWRYVGVAATSLIMAVAYMGGVDRISGDEWWLWAVISLVSAGLASAFLYSAERNDQYGRKQNSAMTELHEANVRLEAALDDNAALHAQLLSAARESGITDERQRMAREVHDTLAQSLAGILTQLQAAEQTMGDPSTAQRHLASAIALARESLSEARRTVNAVTPTALDGRRLPDAIADVTTRWSQANGLDAALTTTGEVRPLHADVEATLLRTAQEALSNVAKHAHATRVALTLSYMEDIVALDIRDDGTGFTPAAATGSADGGFGLVGMRQRVHGLAGHLTIESEPGSGSAISASLPAIPSGGSR